MEIKYLCLACSDLLKLRGPRAVNEIGRKSCASCGDNEDNLIIINAWDYEVYMRATNGNT
jgi:hypothetical protein